MRARRLSNRVFLTPAACENIQLSSRHHQVSATMEPPVRRRVIALTVLAAILAGAIYLVYARWPRLSPGYVYVTDSQSARDAIEMEFRMQGPFRVRLDHRLQALPGEALEAAAADGEVLREEEAASFASWYDFVRNQHYVRLRLAKRDGELLAEGNGQPATVPIWCGQSARTVTLSGLGKGSRFITGGTPIAIIDAGPQRETIWVFAGQSIAPGE